MLVEIIIGSIIVWYGFSAIAFVGLVHWSFRMAGRPRAFPTLLVALAYLWTPVIYGGLFMASRAIDDSSFGRMLINLESKWGLTSIASGSWLLARLAEALTHLLLAGVISANLVTNSASAWLKRRLAGGLLLFPAAYLLGAILVILGAHLDVVSMAGPVSYLAWVMFAAGALIVWTRRIRAGGAEPNTAQ